MTMPAGAGMASRPKACAEDYQPGFVTFAGVSKVYGGNSIAVRDLSLSVAKGEFLTMLGPSGSGKTTTLLMLAGFETPTSGEISIAGKAVRHMPAHHRNIGMVFQNYALFPHMTVAENIGFPLSVRGVARADMEQKIASALDLVRMQGFALRMPKQLSGGQQQRIALARALVFNPPLVLMDEPLGALDRQLREQLQLEIKQIHARLGVTLVYVTHDQSEALTMSDRVAVFRDGLVQQVASPIDLYERPASAFIAQFIGESVQLPGRLIAREAPHCVIETDTGHRIKAFDATAAAGAGARITLSIRPERLVLDPSPGQCAQTVPAEIEDVIYHGDYLRVGVRALGQRGFVVKVPNGYRTGHLQSGLSTTLGWRPEDWRAFTAAAASG